MISLWVSWGGEETYGSRDCGFGVAKERLQRQG